MISTSGNEWIAANQNYVSAAIELVRARMEMYKAGVEHDNHKIAALQQRMELLKARMKGIADGLARPPAIEKMMQVFGLSEFERDFLITCAGVELDSSFADFINTLHGNTNTFLPTFSLMLAMLPNAHWSALSPNASLRYWQMIEINVDQLVSRSPVKIDEHLLHYIAGINHLDERLAGIAEPFTGTVELITSHENLSHEIARVCIHQVEDGQFIPVELTGPNKSDKELVAVSVCRQLGFYPYFIRPEVIPTNLKETIDLARLWNREAALKSYALIVDYPNVGDADRAKVTAINSFLTNIQSLLIVNAEEAMPITGLRYRVFEVAKPTLPEQADLWRRNLNSYTALSERDVASLVGQFNFSNKTINETVKQLGDGQASVNGNVAQFAFDHLWKTCCIKSRPDIGALAQRIEPVAAMDDLVLPDAHKEILRELATQVRYRSMVYNDWGFGNRNSRGLGITALFAGESGTGKTMASEVLAKTLRLDLYRIDLSQVVNKYIGETEKNLKKIFDAAEDGGAILLFDEADALFGKRSEVKDSHDRYANVEISYLLQRMEAYRGLAILTTNMKDVMDKAWMRRIRFVIQFPFPDPEQRAEIWKRIFPPETPVKDLDIVKLARLNIAGGNIRNIAMNAAFMAASEGGEVGMQHLQRALRSEYDKMEKPLTNAEIGLLK